MNKLKPKIVVISFFNKFAKKFLPISIFVLTPGKNIMNIPIIGINAYCTTCKLKKAQVFTLFIRDLKFQIGKKVKSETNLKNIIPEEYHDFLNMF